MSIKAHYAALGALLALSLVFLVSASVGMFFIVNCERDYGVACKVQYSIHAYPEPPQ